MSAATLPAAAASSQLAVSSASTSPSAPASASSSSGLNSKETESVQAVLANGTEETESISVDKAQRESERESEMSKEKTSDVVEAVGKAVDSPKPPVAAAAPLASQIVSEAETITLDLQEVVQMKICVCQSPTFTTASPRLEKFKLTSAYSPSTGASPSAAQNTLVSGASISEPSAAADLEQQQKKEVKHAPVCDTAITAATDASVTKAALVKEAPAKELRRLPTPPPPGTALFGTSVIDASAKTPAKETPAKEAPAKEAPAKEAPAKEVLPAPAVAASEPEAPCASAEKEAPAKEVLVEQEGGSVDTTATIVSEISSTTPVKETPAKEVLRKCVPELAQKASTTSAPAATSAKTTPVKESVPEREPVPLFESPVRNAITSPVTPSIKTSSASNASAAREPRAVSPRRSPVIAPAAFAKHTSSPSSVGSTPSKSNKSPLSRSLTSLRTGRLSRSNNAQPRVHSTPSGSIEGKSSPGSRTLIGRMPRLQSGRSNEAPAALGGEGRVEKAVKRLENSLRDVEPTSNAAPSSPVTPAPKRGHQRRASICIGSSPRATTPRPFTLASAARHEAAQKEIALKREAALKAAAWRPVFKALPMPDFSQAPRVRTVRRITAGSCAKKNEGNEPPARQRALFGTRRRRGMSETQTQQTQEDKE